MRLFCISVCHMQPEIVAFSLTRAVMTMGLQASAIRRWIMVDHHWPIEQKKASDTLRFVRHIVDADVISPLYNLGGHGGINYAVRNLELQFSLTDDDLVLLYDPDSNPVTQGWLQSLVDVMQADPTLDYLSLMHSDVVNQKDWHLTTIANHRVASHPAPEMFNVTLFRGKCIKQQITAYSTFYGHVESSLKSRGFKNAYLIDVREETCPIPHPAIYSQWKREHAAGLFKGNFDNYLITKS